MLQRWSAHGVFEVDLQKLHDRLNVHARRFLVCVGDLLVFLVEIDVLEVSGLREAKVDARVIRSRLRQAENVSCERIAGSLG